MHTRGTQGWFEGNPRTKPRGRSRSTIFGESNEIELNNIRMYIRNARKDLLYTPHDNSGVCVQGQALSLRYDHGTKYRRYLISSLSFYSGNAGLDLSPPLAVAGALYPLRIHGKVHEMMNIFFANAGLDLCSIS